MLKVHYEALQHSFASGITKPVSWRIKQLKALQLMLSDKAPEFEEALYKDLRKSAVEAQITEIGFLQAEISYALKNINRWVKPKKVAVPPMLLPASAWIRPEPLGTVLIISPWNYPLMLLLSPLIGAISAGNAAILKPSELAPNTSRAVATHLPEYLDVRAFRVIEGGVPETSELLKLKFDHIFYTGSGAVGRIIARAAAEHLTPVTLELGGKSPVFVDDTVSLPAVAKRLAWAKFMNAGQTCVAPDYVLTDRATADRLVPLLKEAIRDLYGNGIEANPDYGRIINVNHFKRLTDYLDEANVAVGGASDENDLFIEPTVLTKVRDDSRVMQEEIFGPILPIVEVADYEAAIKFVNAKDKPLSAYVFSEDPETIKAWQENTSSGALTFNAPVLHLTVPELPFGGVGESGTGAYHGLKSFEVFSHQKALLKKPLMPDTLSATIMPPFSELKNKIVRDILKKLR